MSVRGRLVTYQMRRQHMKQRVKDFVINEGAPLPELAAGSFADNLQVATRNVFGAGITTVSEANPQRKHLIYVHGPNFAAVSLQKHAELVTEVIKQTNVTVSYLDFPMPPVHNCETVLPFIVNAYDYLHVQYPGDRFFLMGDSGGAGLILAMLQKLRATNATMPVGTILLSPWTDFSMSNPDLIVSANDDPFMAYDVLRTIGRQYAGEWSTTDPKVSPFYGTFDHLGAILLDYGTSDLIAPDIERLTAKLITAKQTAVQVHKQQGMWHDYVLWNDLPETKKTIKAISRFVTADGEVN
ncbi:alpha/beta hydrolase fold domain-containing protein [Levilactobacillus bambusae]|uniref:Alpha/beta hydrolase n=1 Tax=Levilactobacillus bambusae TaxID=2024736 RepID=A0A2V1MXS3_9LACO|nr:alpha/beta hydrolase [Levilactobacillus bambusae]PWF99798.1 alpha/beta hydrolase [Levilactobacillus bambusae]